MPSTVTDKSISDKTMTPVGAQSIGPGTVKDLGPEEDEDDAILRANGHDQVMPRQFNWISALGLGFSITNSWVGYLVSK